MANEVNKFSIAEACANDNGKTSGSKTFGLFIGLIVGICIIAGVYAFFTIKEGGRMELLNWCSEMVMVCAALLAGTKFISQKFGAKTDTQNDKSNPPTSPPDQS